MEGCDCRTAPVTPGLLKRFKFWVLVLGFSDCRNTQKHFGILVFSGDHLSTKDQGYEATAVGNFQKI